jgi:ABC-type histidine transport system ATPase subunit
MAMIEINDLRKSFGANEVLKGVSFDRARASSGSARAERLEQIDPAPLHQPGGGLIFMDGGAIVEQGPPAQVLASPASARLKLFLRRYQGDYLAV